MKRILGFFLVFNTFSFVVNAETAHLAVAANFRQCMQDLVAVFEGESNHAYVLSFGSSGKLYGQIINGAPYDVFFSADVTKPQMIDEAGYGVTHSRFTYAQGSLVLMSSFKNRGETLEQILSGNNVNKIALANPNVAPYGAASVEVLQHLKLAQTLKPKWVLGENIAQTYQFVHSGNAKLGFVALSQVILQNNTEFSVWNVPDIWHKPIRQQAIVLRKAKRNSAALAFIEFMQSNKGHEILISHGYKLPESPRA